MRISSEDFTFQIESICKKTRKNERIKNRKYQTHVNSNRMFKKSKYHKRRKKAAAGKVEKEEKRKNQK